MTVSTTTTYNEATGAGGVKTFYFTFRCDDSSWVKVYLDSGIQSSGFTVALNADQSASPGGFVTFTSAPDGKDVLIKRQTSLTQDVNYTPYDAFPAETHEFALDRIVLQVQEEARERGDGDAANAALIASEAAARIAADATEAATRAAADAAILASAHAPSNVGIAVGIVEGSPAVRRFGDILATIGSTVNVKEAPFSAVGDGVADDTAAIQAAIDYAIENDVKVVYFPAGTYKISAPLIVARKAPGGSYWLTQAVSLLGDGRASQDTREWFATIRQTDPDQACVMFQKWGGFCEGIAMYGMATHIEDFGFGDILDSTTDWWGTCRYNNGSPHAGIVIDPFILGVAAGDQYPDQSANYIGGSGGSSHYSIRNCYVRDFIVGYLLSPSNAVANGEIVNFDFNTSYCCHTSIAGGCSQALSIFVRNHEAWVNHHTIVDNYTWGMWPDSEPQIGAFPRIEGLNVAGGCRQLFKYQANWANKSGLEVKGLHAESVFSLGNCDYMTLTEAVVHFMNYRTYGVRAAGNQGSIGSAKFVGGILGQGIGVENAMYFSGLSTAEFIGTSLEGPVFGSLTPPEGPGERTIAFRGVKYIYDTQSNGPVSQPYVIHAPFYLAEAQRNRFYDGISWSYGNEVGGVISRYKANARNSRLKYISLGSKVVANPDRATATFNLLSSTNPVLTLTEVALVEPGMFVQIRGYTDWAAQVTDVDYGTGDVTVDILDGNVNADDTYNIAFVLADGSAYLPGMPTQAPPMIIHPVLSGSTIATGQISQIAIDVHPMLLSFTHTNASRYVRVGDWIWGYVSGGFSGYIGQVHSLDGDTVYVHDQNSTVPDGGTLGIYIVHEHRFAPATVADLTSGSADITVTASMNLAGLEADAYPLGARLFGTGIPEGAYIVANDAYPVLTLSAPATATRTSWLWDATWDWEIEGTGLPTVYFYPVGTFVRNTAYTASGTAPNVRIAMGWVKATDAKTNVLNTDWLPVYASVGAGMTQGAAVADGSTVNQLLTSLRAAGLIAT